MPRISGRIAAAAFLAATPAFLVSCAGRQPPATAHVQELADPCRSYEKPTDFGRCRLFTSADGWRYIPEIGRTADLDTQLQCAPARPDPDVYAECIGRALAAAARPNSPYGSESPEELDAALTTWTPPSVEPTASAGVARSIPNPPAAAEPE